MPSGVYVRSRGCFPQSPIDDPSYAIWLLSQPCVYCGGKALQIEHKVPVSRGGSDSPNNLAPSCIICNDAKDNLTDIEFLEWKRTGVKPQISKFHPSRELVTVAGVAEMRSVSYTTVKAAVLANELWPFWTGKSETMYFLKSEIETWTPPVLATVTRIHPSTSSATPRAHGGTGRSVDPGYKLLVDIAAEHFMHHQLVRRAAHAGKFASKRFPSSGRGHIQVEIASFEAWMKAEGEEIREKSMRRGLPKEKVTLTDVEREAMKGYLNMKEAEAYTGVGVQTIRKAYREEELEPVRYGGAKNSRVFFKREELDRWMASRSLRWTPVESAEEA